MEEATRRRVTPTLLLALLVLATSVPAGFCAINPQDASALNALLSQWTNAPASWSSASDPCDGGWDGVMCSNGRVTSLRLSSVNIQGTLSDSVGQLTQLVYLDVSFNLGLNGPMPATIGNLAQLTTLILAGCSFTGSIPKELGNLQQLSFLALNSNKFTGTIPPQLGLLSNLFWLDLADNQLTGSIPVSTATTPGLDQLTHMKHFHFNKNQLSGTLAGLFNSNMNLIHILLDNNQLTGPIPEELGGISSLQVLRLDRNGLQGSIPPNISNLVNLNELNLASNQLTGSLPDLSSMTQLNVVDLSNNSFAGSVAPNWFTTLTSLTSVSISSGQISGPVPKGLFMLPQLQQVVLSNNEFNGTLEITGNISSQLQTINLMNNGIVAANVTSSYNKTLVLLGNPGCQDLDLKAFCSLKQENMIAYNTSLSQCSSTASCSSGQSVDPANCGCAYPYSGKMIFRAPFFTDLTNSATFQQLEQSLTKQFSLRDGSVTLSGIGFNSDDYLQIQVALFPSSGDSFSVADLIRMGFDLGNQTYELPPIFGTYYFIADTYVLLAGDGPSPPSSSPSSASNGTVIGVSVAVATVVVLGLIYCCYKKRCQRRRRPSSTASVSMQPPPPPVTGGTVSYAELVAATGGFSHANLLGQGGFGHVYRGTLAGAEVAIKRLRPGSQQGDREFRTEVDIINRVHHRHLVSLFGYCIHVDQRLLVYEYVPNKTLKFHLHGRGSDRPALDWQKRWRIALGTAKGLAYLHEDCHPKTIHRDIKAANILLDYNFEPKLSDFGLAMIQPADDTHVSTLVKGTSGYLAPEYHATGKLTNRSDVYSFGVVLLELITGKTPRMTPVLSPESDNHGTLVSWSRPRLTRALSEGALDELTDPSLGTSYDRVDMRRLIACAAAAVRTTARFRPRMSQIVRFLEEQMTEEALNAGVEPGQSEIVDDGAAEQLRRMMAFVPGASSTTRGFRTDNMSTSYVSETTSEFGLHPSSSSSDDATRGAEQGYSL